MNYRKVYKALSVKNSMNVFMEIYNGCLTEEFKSFNELKQILNINPNSLRRITNKLSSSGLIKSLKDDRNGDKRRRVYVATDIKISESIKELTNLMAN